MNDVKLSGILGKVDQHRTEDGVPIASARLSFTDRHDCILLVAVDARTRQLTVFGKGAHIRVIGRLTPHNGSFAILVDECGAWLGAKNPGKFAHDETKAERTRRAIEHEDFPML